MNREIKFRGKTESGKWVYGDILRVNDDTYIIPPKTKIEDWITNYENFKVDPETIGQFTGLNDKNNIEIYENDIIKQLSVKLIVKFRYGCFFFCTEKDFGGVHSKFAVDFHETANQYQKQGMPFQGSFSQMALIGNIHDNPELLKL